MRCSCGILIGTGLCVIGHDPTPARRVRMPTVKRFPQECEANPFRKGKAVKGAWPNGYRIGGQRP